MPTEGLSPKTMSHLGTALLAVGEALAVLFSCLLLSLVAGLVLALLTVSPRFDAEMEIEAVRADAAPVGQMLSGLQNLSLARRVETVDDGETRELIFSGLTSPDFPDVAVLELLAASGYRAGEHQVRPAYDTVELLKQVGVPYLTLQALIFIGVGWGMMRLRLRPSTVAGGTFRASAALMGAAAGVTAFVLSAATALLLEWIGLPVQEQEWLLELLGDRGIVLRLLPWIVFIVPISEEVFFRGYLFRLLAQRAGLATGYVVSSAMFSAVHLNPSGFVIYLVIGLILAWVYQRTGSLLAPVVGHVVHNGIVLALALYGIN